MAFFEWDDSYSVGVGALDAQHKEIIKLINRLDEIETHGGDLAAVLSRLDWYVRHHFSFEESLMKGAGYGRFEEHVAEHREFERWLRGCRHAMSAGGGEVRDLGRLIEDYLKDWLKSHILVVDMDYKALLTAAAQRGASLGILADELVKVLEEAKSSPTPDAVEKALSLAQDIQLSARVGAQA